VVPGRVHLPVQDTRGGVRTHQEAQTVWRLGGFVRVPEGPRRSVHAHVDERAVQSSRD
jgi:hypothetical protein